MVNQQDIYDLYAARGKNHEQGLERLRNLSTTEVVTYLEAEGGMPSANQDRVVWVLGHLSDERLTHVLRSLCESPSLEASTSIAATLYYTATRSKVDRSVLKALIQRGLQDKRETWRSVHSLLVEAERLA